MHNYKLAVHYNKIGAFCCARVSICGMGEKGIRWESGTMPSLCTGAAPHKSLGNWEEGGGDERSQETCPCVKRRICDAQIVVFQVSVFFFGPHGSETELSYLPEPTVAFAAVFCCGGTADRGPVRNKIYDEKRWDYETKNVVCFYGGYAASSHRLWFHRSGIC